MIILPEGAFTVIADEPVKKTASGIILTEDIQEEVDTGEICFTSKELNKYQGYTVRFRKNFAEELEIGDTKHLFFRDFDSSIYYLLEPEKTII